MSAGNVIKYKIMHLIFFTIAFTLLGIILSSQQFLNARINDEMQIKNIYRGIIAGILIGILTSIRIITKYKPDEIKEGSICAAFVATAEMIFISLAKVI